MDGKKISFGFSKTIKKPFILPCANVIKKDKVELIKCLEGQKIQLMEEKLEDAPLVIPLKQNQKTSLALASLMKRRAVLLDEAEPLSTTTIKSSIKPQGSEGDSLENRAARELLSELEGHDDTFEATNIVLPIIKADDLPLDGAKESTLDDYDTIPIQHFGMAMLRGMGWTQPPTQKIPLVDEAPFVRPKGMGLGADKALKAKALLVPPEANEVLVIKKKAFVRVLGGKHKDLYGQIEGFDDHSGRVIVKMAIGGAKEAFNEFLCQPVSQREHAEYGKCINTNKYEQYKKMENELDGSNSLHKKLGDAKGHVKTEFKKDKDYANNTKGSVKRKNWDELSRLDNDSEHYIETDRQNLRREKHRSRSPQKSSESFETESDPDSPYERNKHRKSDAKSSRIKSKKRNKERHRRHSSPKSNEVSDSDTNERGHRKKYKKSKKSKTGSSSRSRHRK